jgi:hypothetical protein
MKRHALYPPIRFRTIAPNHKDNTVAFSSTRAILHGGWRTKGEYATLLHVVLRTCTVAVKDIRDVEHSIEVTAETLYEAIATALAALQQDNWVGEIGQGFATVTVLVQQPPVKHEVKMKDFVSWLGRQGRSPAEVILKQKLDKILSKANHPRT